MGLAHLQGRTVLTGENLAECLAALHRPTPRIELGLALREIATSAIDVSDGLLADLAHVLTRSNVSARVQIAGLAEPGLAREAYLSGGDDYELVFTAAANRMAEIAALSKSLELPLQHIGIVCRGEPGTLNVFDSGGADITPAKRGFDHFGQASPAKVN